MDTRLRPRGFQPRAGRGLDIFGARKRLGRAQRHAIAVDVSSRTSSLERRPIRVSGCEDRLPGGSGWMGDEALFVPKSACIGC